MAAPSAPPYAPPPPPPPAAWPPVPASPRPPYYAAPPLAGAGPPPPPGIDPAGIGSRLRDGLGTYRWAILVSLLAQVITLIVLLLNPSVGRAESLGSVSQLSLSSNTGADAALTAAEVVSGILSFVVLILGILAFSKWRTCVKMVQGFASFGAVAPGPAEAAAGYRRSLYTMLGYLLVTIAGAIVIAAAVFSSITAATPVNGTVSPPTSAQVQDAVNNATGAAIGLGVALVVVTLALAYFVTQSLEGFLDAVHPAPLGLRRRPAARLLVYVAVVLSGTSVLNFAVLGAGSALGLIGTAILWYAVWRYQEDLDERVGWLTRAAPPG